MAREGLLAFRDRRRLNREGSFGKHNLLKGHWGTVLGVGISEEAAVVMSGEVVDS